MGKEEREGAAQGSSLGSVYNVTVKVLHYRRGYVAMSNSGEPDTNASQAVVSLPYP